MGCLLTSDDLPPWPTRAASETDEAAKQLNATPSNLNRIVFDEPPDRAGDDDVR